MEGWITIIVLVLIGLTLMYLELIFVPGTTILGLLGLVLSGIGIYVAYVRHGSAVGTLVLGSSLLVTIAGLVYSFRAGTWRKLSLKQKNEFRVNEDYTKGLHIGMSGVAISDLKPIGKAEFSDIAYEVATQGNLISSGTAVKIMKLSGNKIIVTSIK